MSASTTHLDAINEKLARITALVSSGGTMLDAEASSGSAEKKYISRLYGMYGGRECYHHLDTTKEKQDELSKIVQENNGYIHITDGPVPRLLCEDMPPSVDKKQLILTAVEFFYPGLTGVTNAFTNPKGDYCVVAKDECGLNVFMAFAYEPLGSNFDLFMTMKLQLQDKKFQLAQIQKGLNKLFRSKSPRSNGEFSKRAVHYIKQNTNAHQVDYIMLNVKQEHSDKESENIYQSIRNTKYIQLVKSGGGLPHEWVDYMPKGTNLTLCENLTLHLNADGSLDHTAVDELINASVSHYIPVLTKIERFFNQNERAYCRQCEDEDGQKWLLCFGFEFEPSTSKFSLKLTGSYPTNGITEKQLIKLAKDTHIKEKAVPGETPATLTEVTCIIMQELHNAWCNYTEIDFDAVELIRICVDDKLRGSGHRLVIADEFVKQVKHRSGILHAWPEYDHILPATICSELSTGYTQSKDILLKSIPHFFPGRCLGDIKEAFGGGMYLQATDDSGSKWIFVFEKYTNHAHGGDYDLTLLTYNIVDETTFERIQREVDEMNARRSTEKDITDHICLLVTPADQDPEC